MAIFCFVVITKITIKRVNTKCPLIYFLADSSDFFYQKNIAIFAILKLRCRAKKIPMREKLGDFFIDIAKLVFGGVVLSLILALEINKVAVLSIGVFTIIALAIFGFVLYNKK
jgi:hypothetical protein